MTILIFVSVTLCVICAVHEFGHYITALCYGQRIRFMFSWGKYCVPRLVWEVPTSLTLTQRRIVCGAGFVTEFALIPLIMLMDRQFGMAYDMFTILHLTLYNLYAGDANDFSCHDWRWRLGIIIFVFSCVVAGSFVMGVTKPVSVPEENITPAPITQPVSVDVKVLGQFKATAYCPCEKCCSHWANKRKGKPPVTASGTIATSGVTVAVDPKIIPYGSNVHVEFPDGSVGQYVAEDCGGKIKGNRLDIYFDSHSEAVNFGVKTVRVTTYKGEA